MSSETDVAAVLNQIREEAAGGRLDAAESQCRELLMIAPREPEAWSWLGLLLTARGDAAGAEAALRQALSLAADNANYWNYLSVAIRGQGRAAEAEDAARKAIAVDPRHATYWANLGAAVADQQRWLEAGAAYREAIGRQAGDAAAWQALASAESAAGRPNEVREAFERSLAIAPGSDATIGYALLLGQQQEVERAISLLEDYLMRNERAGLGWAVLSELRKNAGDIEGAEAACRRAVASGGLSASVHSNLLFAMQFFPGYDAVAIGAEHRRWNELHARPLAALASPHANQRSANRRLKIGYVSPNFRNHVLSFLTTPLLTAHDRSQVEVFCYSDVASPDPITDHLRSLADAWRDIKGLTDADAADLVRRDSIDILVDITLHMEHNRLLMFARRPAPVQVTWLGYPGTTGMSAIDYRLSDPRLDPPGLFDGCYAEETIRLPDTFWCYDSLGEEPAVNSLPAATRGFITFGCFSGLHKVNAGVLALWARVLKAVERSRLLLLMSEGPPRKRARATLAGHGIAEERIEFVGVQPRLKYLQYYHQVDLMLETLPYNGHTTSLDAFWMGVPVISLVGPTVVGRAGLSQLTNLGLPELVANSADEYVERVASLASDLERLGHLRRTLRERLRRSPLMDAPRFARNIEAAYHFMWQQWCAAGVVR